MEETTMSEADLGQLLSALQGIDLRLARIEEFISAYEPLLTEFTKRMAGPMSWRKGR